MQASDGYSIDGPGFNNNYRDKQGNNALRLAIKGGHLQTVRALQAAGCRLNQRAARTSALHGAASRADFPLLEELAAAGADLGATDREGRSALACAALAGNTPVVQKLPELGAPVDVTDLASAAVSAATEPLAMLLEALGGSLATVLGAKAALHAAAGSGSVESIGALLSAGADISARDKKGRTALLHAAASRSGRVAEVMHALLAAGASVEARDSQGRTALICAAASASSQVVDGIEALLAAGASTEERDSCGKTALMYAAQNPKSGAAVVKALAAAGASINARDKLGRTALHAFASSGAVERAFCNGRSGVRGDPHSPPGGRRRRERS